MLNRDKLKKGISDLYKTDSLDAALNQWDFAFKDYFFDNEISGYTPRSVVAIKPSFERSIASKTFIQDYGKNLSSWASSIVWSNNKDNKSSKVPASLDFQKFSDDHKNDIDQIAYINSLVDLLHNWFSNITV